MKIEKLRLENFKSYQGVHEIGPFDDFVAVIGSNASGKSNCFDAICFVLAAPASSMRCKELSELICNADDTITSASVEMTVRKLNDLIVFKRKVTNSSSTYYVNGSKVSASDYKDSLNEVGFHNKFQSYIIFQGEVGNLASTNPKGITKLIEELSGSIDYKEQYDHLEDDLKKVKENLTTAEEERISITDRYKSVKEEAKIVNEYNDLDLKIKEKEKEENSFTLCQSSLILKDSQSDFENNKKDFEKLREELSNYNEAAKNSDEAINAARHEYKETQKKMKKLQNNFDSLENEIKITQNKEEELNSKLSKLLLNDKQINDEITTKNMEISSLKSDILQIESRNSVKNEYKKEMIELNNKINSSNTVVHAEYQSKLDEKRILEQNIQNSKSNLQNLKEEYEEMISKKIANFVMPHEPELQNDFSNIILQKQKLLNDERQKINSDNQCKNRYNILDILQNPSNQISGIHGFLIQFVSSIRQKYDKAVSALLPSFSNLIVVDSKSVIKQCIKTLKTFNLSGVTFISLDEIENSEILTQNSMINLLSYPKEYKPLLQFLFKDYEFYEDQTKIFNLLRDPSYNKTIIDIDGVVSHVNGFVSCGKYAIIESNPKFVKEIEEEIEKLQKQNEIILKENKTKIDDFEKLMEEYKKQIQRNDENEEKIEELKTKIQAKETEIDQFETNILQLQKEINELKDKFDNIEFTTDLHVKIFEILGCSSIEEFQTKYNEFVDEENKKKEKEAKIEYFNAKIDILKKNDNKNQIKNVKKSLSGVKSELKQLNNSLSEKSEELNEVKSEMTTKESLFNKCQNQKKEMIKKAQNVNKKVTELQTKSNSLQKIIEETRDLINEKILSSDFSSLEEVLLHDFSNELSRFLSSKLTPSQQKQTKERFEKEISQLKEAQSKLKPNFGCQNQLNSLKLLKNESENKIKKLRDLQKVTKEKFNEIKRKRLSLFKDSLDKIQYSLNIFYPRLTSLKSQPLGGNAFLTPENVSIPFNGGISYSVIPPHKRNRNVSNLSGGEQTLAVLALSFALSTVKTAPLFVLDEIDAALDYRNVKSVSDFLIDMSHQHQVIIVSHKSGVFQFADSLIGVTRYGGNSRTFFLQLKKPNQSSYIDDEPSETFAI
ncbi:SMC family, C-terminal domain containing protein [Trichomonas vaginalis G3]|uniref:SMC family, C-terminal domain containing protein n=1 Tax=Trichomonas vaginalis (strain ATCC PRA-98 / G3) TaxID=412133 RepID=A2FBW6_TRIV3|nr:structural maintenance of chromosomes protein family [Trichomonas vaginalis G3]EAX97612.1 SMC family, C-terminal domain containing protein [Trichomonas vaginalis G3]KAI5510574.1 structural maintenance of chromosomes protein family [Trichomonas vaginalis G3]|eukprot:XP_001310542.1 SMC family, C-terminal domain containing protein [Trichomonas vaginalis G3]